MKIKNSRETPGPESSTEKPKDYEYYYYYYYEDEGKKKKDEEDESQEDGDKDVWQFKWIPLTWGEVSEFISKHLC